ncbi:MAG: hypothetical protein WDZ49_11190 [Litorilinea sp.]
MASYEPLHDSREWQEMSLGQRLARYALCYVTWAGFVAVGLYCATLIRGIYLGFLPVWGPWIMNGVDTVAPILIIALLLSYVLFMEHYLRRGVVTQRLGARILRGVLWMVPVTGALYLASIGVPRLLGA